MSATVRSSAADLADPTLGMLRAIKRELAGIRELQLRHDTCFGRIGREVNAVKSAIILIENRLQSRMNESIEILLRLEALMAGFRRQATTDRTENLGCRHLNPA